MELLILAKAIVAVVVIIFAFIILVKSEKFQPNMAANRTGMTIAWLSRFGLATVIAVSFSHFLDIFVETGYHSTRDLAMMVGLALQFARPVHRLYKVKRIDVAFAASTSKVKPFGNGMFYLPAIILVASFFYFGPGIEMRYFPILTEVVYHDQQRFADKVCWKMQYFKDRTATAEYAIYLIRRSDFATFDTTVVRTEEKEKPNVITRQSGKLYDVALCATLPDQLKHETDIAVIGEIKYRTHNLWPYFFKIGPILMPDKITD